LTEGPHLYKKDGYYYLLTAEGGTEYEHACTIARSRWIEGPYEVRPGNPHLLTSALNPGLSLQKAGHGALFTGFDGEWYLAHLCARPIKVDPKAPYSRGTSFSILGRETAIQPVEWIDGWPHIKGSESEPMESFEVVYPAIRGPVTDEQLDYDFSADTLSNDLMHLRIPMGEEVFSLKARTGWLRIYGKDSIVSRYRQSSLFRRQQWFECEAETCMSFSPDSFQQLAGLLYRYNESNQYYLYVSYDEKKKSKYLSLMMFDQGAYLNLLEEPVYFREDTVGLKIEVKGSDVRFAYSLAASGGWQWIEEAYSALKISDEYCWPGFTGAMFGISAQDFSGQNKHADFLHLKFQVYTENRE
jgi:xylan 1,4-beta-xylosidase